MSLLSHNNYFGWIVGEDKHEEDVEAEAATTDHIPRPLYSNVHDNEHQEADHKKYWKHHG